MTRRHRPIIKRLALDGAPTRFACVAVTVGSCLCASTGTAFARREKPVISVFTVAPKSVPSEGTVRVTEWAYDEAGAEECTLSSKPTLAGLPEMSTSTAGATTSGGSSATAPRVQKAAQDPRAAVGFQSK